MSTGHKINKNKHIGKVGTGYGRINANITESTTFGSTERFPTSILSYDVVPPSVKTHHSQKPIALLKDLILTYTNANDTVLDCFAGSGSTAEACLSIDRNCVLIEKDDNIFQATSERFKGERSEQGTD